MATLVGREILKRLLLVALAAVALLDAAGRNQEFAHFVGHITHVAAVK